MSIDPELLPRYLNWRTGWSNGPPTLWDFVAWEGGPTVMAAATVLFWPDFLEDRGCVILAEQYDPDNFARWWESTEGDRHAIEGVMNHLHLFDMFMATREEERVGRGAVMHLGQVLARTWRAAAREAFPDRDFEVAVEDDDDGPTMYLTTRRD